MRATALILIAATACHPTMPEDPESAEERESLRIARKMALAEHEHAAAHAGSITAEHAAADTARASLVADEHAASAARSSLETEVQRYAGVIEAATALGARCGKSTASQRDDALKAWTFLSEYVSESGRDRALAALEPCRRAIVDDHRRRAEDTAEELRQAAAIAVEDAFDADNRFRRGDLVAKPVGNTLQVRVKGNFEGRARHSQSSVELWCDRYAIFEKVVLRNSHGTFSCTTDYVSARAAADETLGQAGLLESWLQPTSGRRPTPVLTDSPPLPDNSATKADLERKIATSTEELTKASDEVARTELKLQRATTRLQVFDEEADAAAAEWRAGIDAGGKKLQIAGVVLSAAGGVSIAVGASMVNRQRTTADEIESAEALNGFGAMVDTQDLEDKYARQSLGIKLGISAGVALLVTGISIAVVGAQRRKSVRVAAAPTGILLRF